MKDKLAAVLFCLIFAAVFGGVGVFATWVIAATIYDGMRAENWVRVKADVESLRDPRSCTLHVQGRDTLAAARPSPLESATVDEGRGTAGPPRARRAAGVPPHRPHRPEKPSDS